MRYGRTSSNAARVVAALVVAGALLTVSAVAATRTPPVQPLPGGPHGQGLDYGADQTGRLRPLDPAFVRSELGGLTLPTASATTSGASVSAAGGGGSATSGSTAGPSFVQTPTYPCVGGHQTEDPLSPPCVAQFSGDNGGGTYQGVSGSEVRIVVNTARYVNPPPGPSNPHLLSNYGGDYHDLWQPPRPDEGIEVRALRDLQSYFNRHYQTYGRKLHFVVYYDDLYDARHGGTEQALEQWALQRPFAVEQLGYGGDDYALALAHHGVMSFEYAREHPASHFLAAPGFLYGYNPTFEVYADLVGSYVCQKVVGKPAALSGNLGDNGRARKLAWLSAKFTGDDAVFVDHMRQVIEGCGGRLDVVSTDPSLRCSDANGVANDPNEEARAAAVVQTMKTHGITTVITPNCPSWAIQEAAVQAQFTPEWVMAFGNVPDLQSPGGSALFDRHAISFMPMTVIPPAAADRLCYRAQREADPALQPGLQSLYGCAYYDGLRQLIGAIQLGGPHLTPAAVDAGIRQLVVPATGDPQVPACYYPARDYTCLKDAYVELWDSHQPTRYHQALVPTCAQEAPDPRVLAPSSPCHGEVNWFAEDQKALATNPTAAGTTGCYLALERGRRYLAWHWPPGNIDTQIRGGEVCE